MTDCIVHRGPDDEGQEIIGSVALGNRRLAVIDLSPNGHMPMWNAEHTRCITYNGEIYNFKRLRARLQGDGFRFRSTSDTEVILHAYEAWGPRAFEKLHGMFALAIWDSKTQELILARDQVGIKPLHYYQDGQVFIFSSEIKSILKHPAVKRELNPKALSHYFSLGFGCVASPLTIFKGIHKLPAAHYATLKKETLTVKPYWSLEAKILEEDSELLSDSPPSFDQAVTIVRDKLDLSVQNQMVADVPVGSFLSGGIDSSLITAFAARHTSTQIKTFSIGFEDKSFDESSYAQLVARTLGTDHHHQSFQVKTLLKLIPEVISKLDEPLADGSILPTFLLSQFTREHVTVALSGDGGDELFAGYPTYIAHAVASWLKPFPKPIISLLKSAGLFSSDFLVTLPPFNHAPNLSMQLKLSRFFDGIDKNLAKQYLNFMGPTHLNQKNPLLLHHQETALPYVEILLAPLRQSIQEKTISPQIVLQYLDYMVYLAEDCLVKTDRASSFNSLEVRVPFLDPNLIEYVFSLPSHYHRSGFKLKHLLKAVAQGILPQQIIHRPKKGFGIPIHLWLRQDLMPQVIALLDKKRLEKQGIFQADYVQRLLNEHLTEKQDHRQVLWNLLVFQWWWDEWMK